MKGLGSIHTVPMTLAAKMDGPVEEALEIDYALGIHTQGAHTMGSQTMLSRTQKLCTSLDQV